MSGLPILSLITFLPLLGAVLIAVLPSGDPQPDPRTALGTALATWSPVPDPARGLARTQPASSFTRKRPT